MSRSDWVEVITAATLVIVAISQIADMTGLTGISLPRDAWTCTQVGAPDQACRQWSKRP